jgi:hypothetical protein
MDFNFSDFKNVNEIDFNFWRLFFVFKYKISQFDIISPFHSTGQSLMTSDESKLSWLEP